MNTFFSLHKKTLFALIVLFSVFLFFYFTKNRAEYSFEQYSTIDVVLPNDYTIVAYRATTQETREKGLSGTTYLASHDGMIFEFPYENLWYFWMKDMLIPIDIVWISKDMTVVHIEQKVHPNTYPHSFGPPSNALYVLELASGISEKTNLKVGDKIYFSD